MNILQFIIGVLALLGLKDIIVYVYNIVETYMSAKRAGATIEYKIYIDPSKKL